jgi:hypothetical protein
MSHPTRAEPHPQARAAAASATLSSTLCVWLVLVSTPEAGAWGAHGHWIATRVTDGRLTPEARAAIRGLLHEGDTLVELANWADLEGHDAVPSSAPWPSRSKRTKNNAKPVAVPHPK